MSFDDIIGDEVEHMESFGVEPKKNLDIYFTAKMKFIDWKAARDREQKEYQENYRIFSERSQKRNFVRDM